MDDFIADVASLPTYYRTVTLGAGLVLFWVLEILVPLFRTIYDKWQHAGLNLMLTFLQLLVSVSFGLLVVRSSIYVGEHRQGFLYWFVLPTWLHLLLAMLAIDCVMGYWTHWLEHKVPWMWRCHIVHHADRHVDVTTALRHHPIETVFRFVGQWLAVVCAGVPLGMLFIYQLVAVFFAQLTHANVQFPRKLDRLLSHVFVTPNMHKVHHHEMQPLTDKNFGNIFSVWDRLFGTFAEVPPDQLRYGIDTLPNEQQHNRLAALLRVPFRQNIEQIEPASSATTSTSD